jgi:hypothetical protein
MMNVLTNDQIRTIAPSAFASAAHESRSERYAYVPTVNVIDAMRGEGFLPVSATQSRSRIPGKSDFTKHMIRFRRDDGAQALTRALGDVSAEVVMINSHDGTSAYNLLSGLFRLVCLNGMVASMGDLESVKIPHSGKIIDRVIEGSYRVIDGSRKALDTAHAWKGIELSKDEQMVFARSAAQLRFDPETQPVNIGRLIAPRRIEDRSNDLWTVFNRAQEGIIRGGQHYVSATNRRQTARAVQGIDKNVGLNQALWTLGAEMAKLKGAVLVPTLSDAVN